jgi:hypothetical protein
VEMDRVAWSDRIDNRVRLKEVIQFINTSKITILRFHRKGKTIPVTDHGGP